MKMGEICLFFFKNFFLYTKKIILYFNFYIFSQPGSFSRNYL